MNRRKIATYVVGALAVVVAGALLVGTGKGMIIAIKIAGEENARSPMFERSRRAGDDVNVNQKDGQALLPTDLRLPNVNDMVVGDWAYASHMALFADSEGKLWLNDRYPLHPNCSDEGPMKVSRTAEGFVADITRCPHARWQITDFKESDVLHGRKVVRLERSCNCSR